MEIALPFGIAAVALIDFFIGIAILCIILLAFATLRWSANAAQGLVGGLPIVGGAASAAVSRFSDAIWNLARGFEEIQATYVWNVSSRFVQLLNATVGVAFRPWAILISNTNNIANEARGDVWWVMGTFVPFITNFVTNIGNIANEGRAIGYYVRDNWIPGQNALNHAIEVKLDWSAGLARYLMYDWRPGIVAWLEAASAKIDVLWGYLPVIGALASFEGGMLARAAALEAELTLQRGRVQVLEQELARVLPLATVAAIGAVAILNLERVARDPCHCLTIGDFSDLPSRIGALESLGP